MDVEGWNGRAMARQVGHSKVVAQQPFKCRMALKQNPMPLLLEQLHVTEKMQRIAKTFLRVD